MPLILHETEEYTAMPKLHHEWASQGVLDTEGLNLQHKRIQWLDVNLRPLDSYGRFQPKGAALIPRGDRRQKRVILLENGLALWQPVFLRVGQGAGVKLRGYISVALSSASSEDELARLRGGLLIGALAAAVISALASQWMVSTSLRPIRDQIQRLTQFTADASHELRHPLTAIRATVGSLVQGAEWQGCAPVVQERIHTIDQATERMSHLVQDLLLLARLDRAVQDRHDWRVFDLADLLDDLVQLYASSAEQAGLALQLRATSLQIFGQPDRLHQLFTNLIINALRFTPEGGRVVLSMQRSGRLGQVSVDDSGPGIAPEHRALVFERFWQADPSRAESGTGLGLAISLGIAEAHGGTLSACASMLGGCRMLVELPLA
jgi:signal transduction histidine kinase